VRELQCHEGFVRSRLKGSAGPTRPDTDSGTDSGTVADGATGTVIVTFKGFGLQSHL